MTDLHKKIIDKYESTGYKLIKHNKDKLIFSNLFSLHFIYILSDFNMLKSNWEILQKQMIDEYVNFEGEIFLEWNFYCIYMLKAETKTDQEKNYILNVEQDRSYSRKYVRFASEIDFLPPGRIKGDIFNTKSIPTEISEQWKNRIGEKLFTIIIDGPKNRIEERLLGFLEEKNE